MNIAPGVERFGEDKEIDALIRKYGYIPSAEVLQAVENNVDLRGNLSAAAHLMHGTSRIVSKSYTRPANSVAKRLRASATVTQIIAR